MIGMEIYKLTYLVLLIVIVNSWQYPRFKLRGSGLLNNSYILRGDLTTGIGDGVNNSLHCVTNSSDCCNSSGQGNWYDQKGREVQQGPDGDSVLYVTRGDGVVYLNRRERGGTSGLWRCDIPDSDGVQQSIYIYLGTPTSGIDSIHVHSPLLYAHNQQVN